MRIATTNQIHISEVVKVLKAGGLVIAPTDTVYGILVDAKNETAVAKLISLKNRPIGKPISIFVSDVSMLQEYVDIEGAHNLSALLPGPYTVVLPSKHTVSKLLESESGTLGVRYITDDFITNLVVQFGSPLTSTSANLAGAPPHYSAESFLKSLPKSKEQLIDLVVDGGKLPHRLPSTVLDLSTPNPQVLRGKMGNGKWEMGKMSRTKSAQETIVLAKKILEEVMSVKSDKPVVFLLHGDLGGGKTTFTQAIASVFNISRVDSPTYTISSEYEIKNQKSKIKNSKKILNLKSKKTVIPDLPARRSFNVGGIRNPELSFSKVSRLLHYDLYNIANAAELRELKIAEQLNPNSIIIIEWAEKLGDEKKHLQQKAQIIEVYFEYVAEDKRMISWVYIN